MNKIIVVLLSIASFNYCFTQVPVKQVKHINQTWVSFNSNWFLNKQYFVQTDLHFRRNNFFGSKSFFFARAGLGYQFSPRVQLSAGYAFLDVIPSTDGNTARVMENRIYQQVGYNIQLNNKWSVAQRIRNEQRWQQVLVNGENTGIHKFSNRLRYLLGFTIPVFKNPLLPQLVVSDEVLMQFGKDIVYNTFDQNRFFIGIKHKVSNSLSYDFGYMDVYQQNANGFSYVQSNTLRLFLYFNYHAKKNL